MKDKDQDLFKLACQKILGNQFNEHYQHARQVYAQEAKKSDCFKQANLAFRAANLVLLDAITHAGISNWRQFMKDNEQPKNNYRQHNYSNPSAQQNHRLGAIEQQIIGYIQGKR